MNYQYNDIIKEGLVTVKVKTTLVSSRKNRWLRLIRQPGNYPAYRLEFYDNVSDCYCKPPLSVVPLFAGDRALIVSKGSSCGVLLNFRDGNTSKFTTQSLYDAEVWMSVINNVVNSSPVGYIQSSPSLPLPPTPKLQQEPLGYNSLMKKNISSIFPVKVPPCPYLPWKTGIHCRLEITSHELLLLTIENPPALLMKWSIDSIMRFGNDNNCFMIETGSYSTTGEGRITFISVDAPEIFKKFNESMNYLLHMNSTTPPI